MEAFSIERVLVGGVECRDFLQAGDVLQKSMERGVGNAMLNAAVGMEMTLSRVTSQLQSRHGSSWPLSGGAFGTVPDRLASRSGQGLRSVMDSVRTDIAPGSLDVTGRISTANLTLHETGGTVRPTASKFLAIPLRAALDSRGLPLKKKPRDWKGTFVAKSRRGNLIVFRRDGGTITPLYLLKQSAYIPPRLRLGETVEANMPFMLSKLLAAFEKEFGG